MSFVSQLDLNAFKWGDKRAGLTELARQAETAERYDDMALLTEELVRAAHADGERLSVEERNLLSVAFKHAIGARRSSWRYLAADETELGKTFRKQVEEELLAASKRILDLLEEILLPKAEGDGGSSESIVFYAKMAGDYYRYVAEVRESDGYGEKAAARYEAASKAAESLNPTNPIRLGLALNYSVCYYEILKDHKKACELAKAAFDGAISKLDQLDETSYKDSTLIMQLLRDNLTLWTSDNNDEDLGVEDVE